MLHDGTGGMLIDPSLWVKKPLDVGPELDEWTRGDWKWKLSGFGIGDPIYILGDCVPRAQDHLEKWGGNETLAQALLTMVPTTDTGDDSVVHYGTEMDVLAKTVPCLRSSLSPSSCFCWASSCSSITRHENKPMGFALGALNAGSKKGPWPVSAKAQREGP